MKLSPHYSVPTANENLDGTSVTHECWSGFIDVQVYNEVNQ